MLFTPKKVTVVFSKTHPSEASFANIETDISFHDILPRIGESIYVHEISWRVDDVEYVLTPMKQTLNTVSPASSEIVLHLIQFLES